MGKKTARSPNRRACAGFSRPGDSGVRACGLALPRAVKSAVQPRAEAVRYRVIVGGAAVVAALLMIFVVFRQQELVRNTGDPYHYGEIARGFLEHGFNKLTRRAASLYPHLLAVVYWLG